MVMVMARAEVNRSNNKMLRTLQMVHNGYGIFRSASWTSRAIALCVAFPPTGVWAQAAPSLQGWRVSPALTVSESFTDNVSLGPAGSERSEWVTTISPGVSVVGSSARLRLNASYSPQLIYRAHQGTTDIAHYLNATGNAELLSRTLFLDFRSSVSQQNVSLLGPQSDSNVNTTNNRTTTKTYGISPYLRHEFGADAIGELRFTHDAVHYGSNSGAASSSTSERIDAKLGSGPSYKLFTWNIALSQSHVEYSQNGQKIDGQNYTFSAGRLITPDLRVNASYGYEDSGYPSTSGQALSGTFWNVGPEWTPSDRTRIAATFGRRYYGPSRSFSASHRAKLAFVGVDYSESVTTTRNNQSIPVTDTVLANAICQNVDATQRPACLSFFSRLLTVPVDFFTEALFLEKRLQANFGIYGALNTISANVFSSNRSSISTATAVGLVGDFNSSLNIKQTGAAMSWAVTLSPTLRSNTSLSLTRNTFSGQNRTDRLMAVRVGLTKEFTPKLSGAFTIGRVKSDSSAGAASSYIENSASATLGLKF